LHNYYGIERHLLRKEEGKEYSNVLTGRVCEDEQIGKRRTTEDGDIDRDERALDGGDCKCPSALWKWS
jgi:hypothetical protein